MTKLTDQEEITRTTYNKQAKQWASSHGSKGFWHKEFQEFRTLLPQGKILEIGSGAGRDAKEFIETGYGYLGTDVSVGLLNQAQKNNPSAEFKEISLYDLDFPEKFDGFWCTNVLLHIPRQRTGQALRAIHGCIKKHGIGFITLKQGKGEEMEVDPNLKGSERYFVYWQAQDFQKLLQSNGFEVIKQGVRPMGSRPDLLTFLVSCTK